MSVMTGQRNLQRKKAKKLGPIEGYEPRILLKMNMDVKKIVKNCTKKVQKRVSPHKKE
jgi:hypothetical protein